MRGNLQHFQLAEALQVIADLGKSGKLMLARDDEEAVIIFRNGRVICAASSTVRETLGSLLIGQNLTTGERLQEALDIQRGSAGEQRLGNILVRLGYLSPDNLRQVVTQQTRGIILDLLQWQYGTFEFVALEVEDRGEVRSEVSDLLVEEGLSATGLLMGAAQAYAETSDDLPGSDDRAQTEELEDPEEFGHTGDSGHTWDSGHTGDFGHTGDSGPAEVAEPEPVADATNDHETAPPLDTDEERPARDAALLPAESLQRLLEADTVPTLAVDRNGKILLLNESLAAHLGSSIASVAGQDLFSFVHPEDRIGLSRWLSEEGEAPVELDRGIRLRAGRGSDRESDRDVYLVPTSDGHVSEALMLRASSWSAVRPRFDPLTGLLARDGLVQRASAAIDRAQSVDALCAVLLIDLHRLRTVNESLGWQAGDELLRAVADRIADHLRPGDAVARIGGDRFALLVESLPEEGDVELVARRLEALLSKPYTIAGEEVAVTVRLGASVAREGCAGGEELLGDAESALRVARSEPGQRVRIFTSRGDRAARARTRLGLARDLRHAIDKDQLAVRYKPLVSLETGAVVALELSARWRHPKRGVVRPGDFLPGAEAAGLLAPIRKQLLELALDDLEEHFSDAESQPVDLVLALRAPDGHLEESVRCVVEILEARRLEAERLTLEVPASAVEPEECEVLAPLTDRGVRLRLVASELSTTGLPRLSHPAVDSLRIDGELVRRAPSDPSAAATLRALTSFAAEHDVASIADGVDLPEHLNTAGTAGCQMGQGALFGAPKKSKHLGKLLKGSPPWQALVDARQSG